MKCLSGPMIAASLVVVTFPLIHAQAIAYGWPPPYALQVISGSESLNGAFIQKDNTDGVGLFIHSAGNSPLSSAWTFDTTGQLNETQMMNDTTQLIILGHRPHMWDPEPPSMQMSAIEKSHAQTGYPGTPWPSVYNAAKWQFDVVKDQGAKKWKMLHGYDHGSWRASPDMYLLKEDTWSIYWWSGTFCFHRLPLI